MSSSQGTILIVEDEPLIALGIESTLEDLGFHALVASTLEEAHSHLATAEIRLAVLDYKLREGKTTGIAAILRERHIPFVVCSGSQFHDIASVFEGAPVVPKPFTDDLLTSTVTNALRGA